MPKNKKQSTSPKQQKEASSVKKPSIVGQYLLPLVVFVIGFYRAIDLRWVSDDAFITFRYVKNFVSGLGIVYNAGERVEGYTHFLWLLLLSLARLLGLNTVDVSVWLGIACYTTLLVLYLAISRSERQLRNPSSSSGFAFPLTAAILAVHYDMNVWASGGLETALYTLLISVAFYLWFYSRLSWNVRLLTIGGILSLVSLTRPDGVLFTTVAVVLLVVISIRNKIPVAHTAKSAVLLLLPSILVGIPYLLWKYNYYGDIFPTTYYAKSADQNYFGQGFFYIWLFFRVYFTLGIALVGIIYLVLFRRRLFAKTTTSDLSTSLSESLGSPTVVAATAVIVYLVLFVARVGGDFMFARFIIPVVPLMYFIVERSISQLEPQRINYRGILPLVLFCAVILEGILRENMLFHTDPQTGLEAGNWDGEDGGSTHGIADERWVYMRKRFQLNGVERGSMDVYSDIGKYYQQFFEGLPVKVAITGAQNMIAYYADFPTCINEYGLTDKYIAHLPITKRGRIGHEKMAPEDYFVKRGVQFQLFAVTQKLPETGSYDMAVFEIPEYGLWQLVKVITYDKDVVDELLKRFRAAGNRSMLPKYEFIMPNYLEKIMPTLPPSQVAEDYMGFKRLYFDRYPDSSAQRRIEAYIATKK
jgi:hypothetical protein